MNTAELLDTVFELYKKTFWRQMVRAMLFGAPAYAAIIVVLITGAFVVGATGTGGLPAVVSAAVVAAIFLVWDTLGVSGGVSLTEQAFYKHDVSLDVMFKDIKKNFLRVLASLAATALLALPPLAAAVFLLAGLIKTPSVYSPWLTISPGTAVCLALLIFMIIFASVSFFNALTSAAAPAAAIEKKIFAAAVLRSFSLLKGDIFKTGGVFMLWRLITGSLELSFMVVFFLVSGSFTAVLGAFSEYAGPGALFSLLGNNWAYLLVSLVLSPLGCILNTAVYFNQRIKKEGFDMEIELAEAG